ncbi:hypothetical protein Aple_010680 [Acrocarpospora pleiomorpha]|uniref:Uncharacterized protein n=2 Tax=Acrocarpospora pleiomorpha TaxID=90975 RepID=A0A5M3XGT0_9ACTN|nr:hypothetical protein Aple_010680 [Acrocarpospora pleiomorpha]
MIVTVTGAPTSATVLLEGSHDGVRWAVLDELSEQGQGGLVTPATAHLVRYVRARLQTLSGGSDPTVTATIASD